MSLEINKELIDSMADYLIKQRNFRKEGNILLLPICQKGNIPDEVVKHAHKKGIFFKFDTREQTLLPFGGCDSYTLKAGYMQLGKPAKQSLWQRIIWKLFGWRGRTGCVFSKEALKEYRA